MAWQTTTAQNWLAEVHAQAGTQENKALAEMITGFQLLPAFMAREDIPARIHQGALTVEGDFTPDGLVTVIFGDLTVSGQVSTQEAGGFDGNATLVVFGHLRCDSVVNDWASLLIVSGDLQARDFVYAAREDSSLIIGQDFVTPIFVGNDIWANVGGASRIDMGMGYTLPLGLGAPDTSRIARPSADWQAMATHLGLEGTAREDLQTALEMRLSQTGSLLP